MLVQSLRWMGALVIGLVLGSPAIGQDMPLSQILIDGEGWRAVRTANGPMPRKSHGIRTRTGLAYETQTGSDAIRLGSTQDRIRIDGLKQPAGMTLWPDQSTLVVGDAGGKALWALRIEKDGNLTCAEPYYPLRMRPGETASGVTALTTDDAGRVYACTPLGVQVFDPTGRLCGVLAAPGAGDLTHIEFLDEKDNPHALMVVCGNQTFIRKVKARGVTLK